MSSHVTSHSQTSWLTIAVVSLGVIFTALDQTIVVTVLPEMMLDMEIPVTSLDQASWIITGYLLGYTVAIPLVARVSDAYGHALVFRGSLVLFAITSILVALSPNLPWLVGSRVLQAIGGGAMVPVGMALVAQSLPGNRKAIAVGIVGASAELGIVLGPLYGGGITAALGWRWLFWLDVPQAAIILFAVWAIPNRRNPHVRVDYLGGIILAAALTVLVIALSQRGLFTLSSPLAYILAASGVLLTLGLVVHQSRAEQPLLTSIFFRSRIALAALSTKFLVGAALIIALVTVPLMADTVLGQSSLEGGLRLMRLTGAIPLGAIVGSYAVYRVGPRTVTVVGLLVAAAGLFLMSTWTLDIAEPRLSLHLIVAGLGFGLVVAPLFVSAMEAGSSNYQATAASLVTVCRMAGMALGLAALSAWGMEHFHFLTAGLELPLQQAGETAQELEQRSMAYQQDLSEAGITLFQRFFRGAGLLLIAGILTSLGLATKLKPSIPPTGDRVADVHES